MNALTNNAINSINMAINLATPLAFGDPIPDVSGYGSMLESFPRIDREAQAAYDMAVDNEALDDWAQTMVEASDRLSALYTMLCDLIPARDASTYDFNSVSCILPYFTFTLSVLNDILDELETGVSETEEDGTDGETEGASAIYDNQIYRRIFAFVAESLPQSEFTSYALRQLERFSHGEDFEPFYFTLTDGFGMIRCGLRSGQLTISFDLLSSTIGWDVRISADGDVYGQLDSDDLRGVENWKLIIEEPARILGEREVQSLENDVTDFIN